MQLSAVDAGEVSKTTTNDRKIARILLNLSPFTYLDVRICSKMAFSGRITYYRKLRLPIAIIAVVTETCPHSIDKKELAFQK